jgi:NAD(P)-dependent dehydrogenase (short-subunit alcohol dehydrogenase family)
VALLSRTPATETLEAISLIKGLPADEVSSRAVWIPCDIASEAGCVEAVRKTVEAFGDTIHILVNNAALFVFKSIETATAEDWDASAGVNIKGHALLTKSALPHMKRTFLSNPLLNVQMANITVLSLQVLGGRPSSGKAAFPASCRSLTVQRMLQ